MKKIEFSEEDKKKFVDMYKNGISAVKIAKQYGCSKNPITRILNESGIELDTVLRKVPKTDYEKVIELYNSGYTQSDIANIYGCSKQVIAQIMRNLGVKTRPNGFTEEDAENMYRIYKNGARLPEIARIYGSNEHTIGRVLQRNGFATDRKTYHCNENYFDEIDTVDKAYILGLLWADGHNDVKRSKITLQLQEEDKALLCDINKAISSDSPLWFYNLHDKNENWSNSYLLTLQSKHMSSVLESYGMVQQKSLVLRFPDIIDKSLYGPFIRGYLDGDGSICFNKDTRKTEVSMVGTVMFLERVQQICSNFSIKASIYKKNRGNDIIRTLHITNKKDRVKFLNWIYLNANIKMERKYIKYQQLLEDYNINNSLIE